MLALLLSHVGFATVNRKFLLMLNLFAHVIKKVDQLSLHNHTYHLASSSVKNCATVLAEIFKG